MMRHARKPLLGFAAYSGTGKTTLLEKLIPPLHQRGLRLAVVKHAHHDFDIDHPGKDSYRLRKAGAEQTLVASARRWALITETGDEGDPALDTLLRHLDQDQLDLVLVEGFKHESFPRIELHRPAMGRPLLYPQDSSIIAIATDEPLPEPPAIEHLDLNDVPAIAAFVLAYLKRHSTTEHTHE